MEDFNDKYLGNVPFLNSVPASNQHLTLRLYVDHAIDESTLVRMNQNNGFSILS